ncbi:MAG TPA: SH3 domain-containing protein [Usitatibacter sp.]|nr:SH3 domain-containing protein [Usitatibacter sp.]
MRVPVFAASIVLLLASAPAGAGLEWDVRDGNHPVLGAVRFAHLRLPVATRVGDHRIYSNAYVSCEPKARTMAVELTNQVAPDDPGGLKAASMPRLVCQRPGGGGMQPSPIDARWEFNGIGDAMAAGLAPRALRECSTIGIGEQVVLPAGWGPRTAAIAFEIAPDEAGLDPVFAACGAGTALVRAQAAPEPWKTVRTVAHGKTNVRARPTLHSSVVAQVYPGDLILAEPTAGDWWRVKSRHGTKFEGYVRRDRLVVDWSKETAGTATHREEPRARQSQ